jgi:hypothetical protein
MNEITIDELGTVQPEICILIGIKESAYDRIVETWKKDKEEHINKLCPETLCSISPNVMVIHDWPSGDGILLLKSWDESIDEALKILHPQHHKFIDDAIQEHGIDKVRDSRIYLKAIKGRVTQQIIQAHS